MKRSLVGLLVAAGLGGVVLVASCTGDTGPVGPSGATGATGPTGAAGPTGSSGVEVFRATMTGANEVPAVTTTATGTATVTNVGGILTYRVDVANINNVTAAHIHGPASTTQTAGVKLNFYVPPAGTTPVSFTTSTTLASDVATVPNGISTDSLLVLLRNGQAYANVHTSANGGGEIRGQFVRVP